MRNLQLRLILSTVTLFSILMATISATAAPVKFEQVRQIINAKPGKAKTNAFSRLSLISAELAASVGDDDDKTKTDDKNKAAAAPIAEQTPPQDDRVITETTSEIVEDEVCDCVQPAIATKPGFPKYALLGLAAIPLLFLIPRGNDTPTPPPTTPTTETPTPTTETPTPTPETPTPTPETPTPTPPTTITPTPPTEPIPEPMTILLFGTGLASVGMAARKKFSKKAKEKTEE